MNKSTKIMAVPTKRFVYTVNRTMPCGKTIQPLPDSALFGENITVYAIDETELFSVINIV